MISIGKDKKWSIVNSDVFGDIFSAAGVSFDERGYIKLSKRPTSLYSSADSASFGLLLSVVYYNINSLYYLVTSAGILTINSTFDVSVIGGSPFPTASIYNDAIAFNNKMYVVSDTSVYTLSTSTWADLSISLTAGVPKCLEVLPSGPYWALGHANTIRLYDTSNSLVRTLTIPADYQITSLKYRQNNLYVATKHLHGGEAQIFIWSGTSTAYQASYGVRANKIYSLADYGQSVVAATSAGQFLYVIS